MQKYPRVADELQTTSLVPLRNLEVAARWPDACEGVARKCMQPCVTVPRELSSSNCVLVQNVNRAVSGKICAPDLITMEGHESPIFIYMVSYKWSNNYTCVYLVPWNDTF